ncbi:antitoxin Xre/MbcA/ParS toxin-binding domain-containing protein [Sphingopyxis italica]|uniref:antitoxin Xre/MbcA/ParS toxin-binding domain-containing protein n=1 Tax=Sphingopyxis italica TaxID=1129133 RepID=UPI001ADA8761
MRTLFDDDQEGVAWLLQLHDARVFGGAAPIDLITGGTQDALLTVRRFLDAARGGLYMAPSSDERDWPLMTIARSNSLIGKSERRIRKTGPRPLGHHAESRRSFRAIRSFLIAAS